MEASGESGISTTYSAWRADIVRPFTKRSADSQKNGLDSHGEETQAGQGKTSGDRGTTAALVQLALQRELAALESWPQPNPVLATPLDHSSAQVIFPRERLVEQLARSVDPLLDLVHLDAAEEIELRQVGSRVESALPSRQRLALGDGLEHGEQQVDAVLSGAGEPHIAQANAVVGRLDDPDVELISGTIDEKQ